MRAHKSFSLSGVVIVINYMQLFFLFVQCNLMADKEIIPDVSDSDLFDDGDANDGHETPQFLDDVLPLTSARGVEDDDQEIVQHNFIADKESIPDVFDYDEDDGDANDGYETPQVPRDVMSSTSSKDVLEPQFPLGKLTLVFSPPILA